MADESILDKAAALIPGVGGRKGKVDSRQKQLQAIHRKLAALAKDVETLAAAIAAEAKDAMGKASAKKPGPKGKVASAAKAAPKKTPAAKPAAAPKKTPAARKPARKTATDRA